MKKIISIISLLIFVVGLCGVMLAVFNDDNVYATKYTYSSNKVNENIEGFKIAQISDFHSHSLEYKNINIIDLIKNENPNVVAFTGDIIDNRTSDLNDIELMFDELKDYPILVVSGNHEVYAPLSEEYFELVNNKENVIFLDDKHYTFEYNSTIINFYGIHDPRFDIENELYFDVHYGETLKVMDEFSKDMDHDEINILLSHRPELVEGYSKYGFDIMLSGHTHGGQLNLLGWTPYVVNQFFPKYLNGIHKVNDTTLYISNGLGYSLMLPVRLHSPMEVVFVSLGR